MQTLSTTNHNGDDQKQKWITYNNAVRIFTRYGLSESTFARSRKSIRSQLKKPTSKRHHYSEQDTIRVALQKSQGEKVTPLRMTPPITPARFYKATPQDMPELADLIEDIFETRPHIERWQALMQQNPEIGSYLREENETASMVGCAFIYPHTEQKVLHILDSELTPPTIPEDILSYQPGQRVHLYLRTIGIRTDASIKQKRHWAAVIVRNLLHFIEDLGRRGIIIEKIWSRSETPDGINILRHMRFTQIETHTGFENYMIDVPLSGIPMMMRYKKAYQEWLRRTSGEAD